MRDLRQGCASERQEENTARADALVLFGAMGDFAYKKIFPALYHMVRHGHLDVPVIGVARAGRTDEHLRERVRDSITQHCPSCCNCFAMSAVITRNKRLSTC